MATMIVEVYDAPRAIDVPDDQAKAAARALTQDMTGDVAALRTDTTGEFATVRRGIEALLPDFAVTRSMIVATAPAVLTAVALKPFLA